VTKSFRVSQINKMRECKQVAAVCYRVRRGVIEFLLVQTRGGGRWTFPKGSAEPGLTHAQAAAIEAFEEGGVHGRIEEAAFTQYVCRRPGDRKCAVPASAKSVRVSAHLCEVRRLGNPKESNRNRTWFLIEDAIERLQEGRKKEDGKEFARVVQRAVARITRFSSEEEIIADRIPVNLRDELNRVQFDAQPQIFNLRRAQRLVVPSASHAREMSGGDVLPFDASRHMARRPSNIPLKMKALAAKNT
jgi:8-oxo-dGTP pyrophosphatase MutT (NUDIX family)